MDKRFLVVAIAIVTSMLVGATCSSSKSGNKVDATIIVDTTPRDERPRSGDEGGAPSDPSVLTAGDLPIDANPSDGDPSGSGTGSGGPGDSTGGDPIDGIRGGEGTSVAGIPSTNTVGAPEGAMPEPTGLLLFGAGAAVTALAHRKRARRRASLSS